MTAVKKLLRRWLPLLFGALLILLGVVAVIWSDQVVQVLPVVLGVCVVCLGVWETYRGASDGQQSSVGLPRFWQGIVNIVVGMVLILNRSVSVAFLGVALGIWCFISGVLSLCMAWTVRHTYGIPAFLDGGFKVLAGAFMMTRPFGGMAAWVVVMGVFLIYAGATVIISTFYWNKPEA